MTETFRITLAQLNPTMGDLRGNAGIGLAQIGIVHTNRVIFRHRFVAGREVGGHVCCPVYRNAAHWNDVVNDG